MKYKTSIKDEIKDNFLLVNLISDDTIANLNRIFGTHITKNIKRRRRGNFDFWDKLMRTKPGFWKSEK